MGDGVFGVGMVIVMPFAPADFLDLDHCAHRVLFENVTHVWEAIDKIAAYLKFILRPGMAGEIIGTPYIGPDVFIGEGAIIEHGAVIKGPAWIGAGCHVRAGCYVRENVVVGDGAVLGNSCEFKNCLLLDGAQAPHFSYVGDSILGYKSHLGAGSILSNVRLDRKEIAVETGEERLPTGLRKFGAVVGDHAEIGCNAVLNPGSVIGPRAVVYPGVSWRGVLPANHVAKTRVSFSVIERRD